MNFTRLSSLRSMSQAALALLGSTSTPPKVEVPTANVTALPVAHSPIFDAARELLVEGHDVSSSIVRIRELRPDLSVQQAHRILREAAAILHCSGERHDEHSVGNGGW